MKSSNTIERNKSEYIIIKGARVNNLKNISLKIPRNAFIAVTGVSGSGKSSLAFDTLYAEGQRRYVESLSSYARQFLGRISKPECDFIHGLPPAIAIQQKVISRNPRSTVGTSTEIYEYLRLLFARIGHTISPISGNEVKVHSTDDVITCVQNFSEGTRFMVLAPFKILKDRSFTEQLNIELQQGYTRIFFKNEVYAINDLLQSSHLHQIDTPSNINEVYLVIDRLSVSTEKDTISRLTDSVETAFYQGEGSCRLVFLPSNITYDFSQRYEADGLVFEVPSDNLFAFNSPLGACPTCEGFGNIIDIDERLVIPNTNLSVANGCIQCWHGDKMGNWLKAFMRQAQIDNFPIFTPYYKLTQQEKDWLWHGLPSQKEFPLKDKVCIDAFFQMVQSKQDKIQYRVMLSRYRGKTLCPTCHGTRLKQEATWVKIDGRSITDLVEMPISRLASWFDHLTLSEHEALVAKRLLTEIKNRLRFINEVGLGYLTLNRLSNTLSGGESQRINLTTSLGSSLVGSLYILDEPSIGLHSRDTERLIRVLQDLRDIGNTVVVVEHDEEIMRAADWLIDVGPNAGRLGGEIVYEGHVPDLHPGNAEQLLSTYPHSHTIEYLTHKDYIIVPKVRRQSNHHITITGCRMNNLKGIDVTIPLHSLCVITGVSGSGKSSLIKGTLFPALKRALGMTADAPGEHNSIGGDWKTIKYVEFVDQNPIGISSRSNPATYVKAYDAIRSLFANQPLAQQMGLTARDFSFNEEGGRCEECKGTGVITVEMQFMADLSLTCEACHGQRFQKHILDVRFHENNINDVLNMTVSEAIAFFTEHKQKLIAKRLKPLEDVGLGYIKLGQSSSTLSGGENQRVKLAYFISQEKQEPSLFIFDEPTTGLHFHDIKCLLHAFDALIDRGHSIIVVEHNLDVIKMADYVVDLGPDGGEHGGYLVFQGTPEKLTECPQSITGKYLKDKLS